MRDTRKPGGASRLVGWPSYPRAAKIPKARLSTKWKCVFFSKALPPISSSGQKPTCLLDAIKDLFASHCSRAGFWIYRPQGLVQKFEEPSIWQAGPSTCDLCDRGSRLARRLQNIERREGAHDFHGLQAYGNHAAKQIEGIGGIAHRLIGVAIGVIDYTAGGGGFGPGVRFICSRTGFSASSSAPNPLQSPALSFEIARS